jgi:hypothetical protein
MVVNAQEGKRAHRLLHSALHEASPGAVEATLAQANSHANIGVPQFAALAS